MVLDVVLDVPEDAYLGQTLKRPFVTDHLFEEQKHGRIEDLSPDFGSGSDGSVPQHILPKDIGDQSNYSFSENKGLLVDFDL